MTEEPPERSPETTSGGTDAAPAPGQQRTGVTRSVMRFTKKQVLVAAGAVVLAVFAVFTTGLQNLVAGLLPDGWDEPGSAIKVVDVQRVGMSGRVLIPSAESGAGFSDLDDAFDSVNDAEWQADHEWYAAGKITFEVTLVGRRNDPVVITDLRPMRTGPCTKRLQHGTLVEDIPQGEGTKIQLKTAIDAKVPKLTSVEDGSAYFDDGTVTLSKGETVIVSIQATSSGATCQWVFEADYVDNGRRKSMTIEAPGDRPFGITGYGEHKPYERTWSVRCDRALTPDEVRSFEDLPDCW